MKSATEHPLADLGIAFRTLTSADLRFLRDLAPELFGKLLHAAVSNMTRKKLPWFGALEIQRLAYFAAQPLPVFEPMMDLHPDTFQRQACQFMEARPAALLAPRSQALIRALLAGPYAPALFGFLTTADAADFQHFPREIHAR